ncbi:hypothetical protein AMAG_18996 [Allomyces macrogynus ATCC 38327]|uniref:Membrane anchor Opy2 N-terminal domain-containing protein n=1 Tax=Allomyces macrogynus (strain ATCC 38327) TaxID=578462 RepID=A0A0L0SLN9_ALLM3|nr:hypothetical protein AMAG_18996 [Allomyces macrogynus ATCC 38327]|eukprot:KNE63373.1 hypothetical protein AMAG_18996 [Allomyces macrogynus ATCC 38327]
MTCQRVPIVLLGLALLLANLISPATALDTSNALVDQQNSAACVQCLIGPRECHPACPADQVCVFVPQTCDKCSWSACMPDDTIPDGWLLWPYESTEAAGEQIN